jgi:hypothetical protein
MNLNWKSLLLGAVLTGAGLCGRQAIAQTAGCNSNDPTAPCFASTSDILSGRKSLLRDDDLVVNGTLANDTGRSD